MADEKTNPRRATGGGFFCGRLPGILMPFTHADFAAVDQAIASGELRVRFEDGRQVDYRSVRELTDVRQLIQSELEVSVGSHRPRAFRVATHKGI